MSHYIKTLFEGGLNFSYNQKELSHILQTIFKYNGVLVRFIHLTDIYDAVYEKIIVNNSGRYESKGTDRILWSYLGR